MYQGKTARDDPSWDRSENKNNISTDVIIINYKHVFVS